MKINLQYLLIVFLCLFPLFSGPAQEEEKQLTQEVLNEEQLSRRAMIIRQWLHLGKTETEQCHVASIELMYYRPVPSVRAIIPHVEVRAPLTTGQRNAETIMDVQSALGTIAMHILGAERTKNMNTVQINQMFGSKWNKDDGIFEADKGISMLVAWQTSLSTNWDRDSENGMQHDYDPRVDKDTINENFIDFRHMKPGVAQVILYDLLILYSYTDTGYSMTGGYITLVPILEHCPSKQKTALERIIDQKDVTEQEKNDIQRTLYPNMLEMIVNKIQKDKSGKAASAKVNHKSCWQFTEMFGQKYIVDYKHCEDKDEEQYEECIVNSFMASMRKLKSMYEIDGPAGIKKAEEEKLEMLTDFGAH